MLKKICGYIKEFIIEEYKFLLITTILNSVDDMKLLKDVKKDLLVFAIEQVGILETDELEELKQNKDSLDFTKEKNILINVADKIETLSGLGNLESDKLEPSDIENIDYLLDNLLASDIFSEKVVTSLASIFESANIIPDDSNTTINEVILSVENWDEELTLIKSMLTISGADGLTEQLFTNIEDSDLLGACKYNIMIMMVNMVNDSLGEGVTKLSVPTVDNLGVVVDASSGTTQYDIEKRIILNVSKLESVDFENMDSDDIEIVSPILEDMSISVIFNNKYSEIVEQIKDSIANEEYGVTTTTNTITDWSEELTILMNIKDGMSKLEDLTGDSKDAEVIGALLENIDDSKLISKSSSQNVANKIVSNLTDGKITYVSKHENGWEYTFDTLIEQLNGGN